MTRTVILPYEIWEIIGSWLQQDSILEFRRANKFCKEIANRVISNQKGVYMCELDKLSKEIPDKVIERFKNSGVWKDFQTKEGKTMTMLKCLKWLHSNPWGICQPYWYFVNTRLTQYKNMTTLPVVSYNDYILYTRQEWKLLGKKGQEEIKYECRLENFLEYVRNKGIQLMGTITLPVAVSR